ncbi:MFS transporter [Salinarchaeum laminariae]|uniref:MFS transporter n=1 Tax=Salinarchaeum laminariae TaxID=869888 RepID=UPI0020C11D66|nr:MFS transporter [Salinarchaeum laminariae]
MPSRRVQVFGSLCAMVFLVNFGRVIFAPLVGPLSDAFGLSGGSIGLIVTLAWLGSAVPRLPAGYALTKVPRHWVILAAGATLTIAAALTAAAPSPLAVAIGAFLMGLASGAYFIAANPLVSELFPNRVGRVLGIHGAASQVAAVLAPLTVSAVLLVGSWRHVFVVVACVAALGTAAFFLAARRAELPDAGTEDRDLLAAVRRQWRLILTGVVLIGVVGLLWNGFFNFYATYLEDVKGLSSGTANLMLTVIFAAGVPAFYVGGGLADRFDHVPFVLAVVTGFTIGLLSLTLVSGLAAIVAVSLVIGFVIHCLFPAMDTYLLDTLPDEHRASAYAVYSATMMLIQASGSVLIGSLTDAGIAFDAVFRGLALLVLGIVVVMAGLYLAGWLPTGGKAHRRTA